MRRWQRERSPQAGAWAVPGYAQADSAHLIWQACPVVPWQHVGCAAQLAQAAEYETSSACVDSEGSAGPARRVAGRAGLRKRRAVSGPAQRSRKVLEAEMEGEHASRDGEEVSGGVHLVPK